MAGFNRRVWRGKPPMGTRLASGLYAPDRIAFPFNEIGVGGGFFNYAAAPPGGRLGFVGANSPVTAIGPNGPALSFAGATQHTTMTGGSALLPTSQATIMIGLRKRDATLRSAITLCNNTGGGAGRVALAIPFSDGNVYWQWEGSGGTQQVALGGQSFVAGGYDVWTFTVGSRGMEIWRGGRLVGSNGNTPVRTAGTQDLWLGFDGANGSDLIDIDFFYVWGTQLPTQVIQAFSLLPFQVFQNHHVQSFATSVAVSYPYLAGGGIQFGGAAGARRTFSHRFLPSSGLRLGGAATIARSIVHPFLGGGGLEFMGSAPTARAIVIGSATGSGGLQFLGAAPTRQQTNFVPVAGGGLIFGGGARTTATSANLHRGNTSVRIRGQQQAVTRTR